MPVLAKVLVDFYFQSTLENKIVRLQRQPLAAVKDSSTMLPFSWSFFADCCYPLARANRGTYFFSQLFKKQAAMLETFEDALFRLSTSVILNINDERRIHKVEFSSVVLQCPRRRPEAATPADSSSLGSAARVYISTRFIIFVVARESIEIHMLTEPFSFFFSRAVSEESKIGPCQNYDQC